MARGIKESLQFTARRWCRSQCVLGAVGVVTRSLGSVTFLRMYRDRCILCRYFPDPLGNVTAVNYSLSNHLHVTPEGRSLIARHKDVTYSHWVGRIRDALPHGRSMIAPTFIIDIPSPKPPPLGRVAERKRGRVRCSEMLLFIRISANPYCGKTSSVSPYGLPPSPKGKAWALPRHCDKIQFTTETTPTALLTDHP